MFSVVYKDALIVKILVECKFLLAAIRPIFGDKYHVVNYHVSHPESGPSGRIFSSVKGWSVSKLNFQ